MSHPNIENKTPYAFEPLFLSDEVGHILLVPLVKATYIIQNNQSITLAEKQVPVNIAGECRGDPDKASYKYEPEAAFTKIGTDIVLIGHAHAPQSNVTEVDVALKVDRMVKTIRVVGDRYWFKSLGMIKMTKPKPFSSIPLIYERAFGGWDRSHPDPEKHTFEPRNPIGVGFRGKHSVFEEGVRLPNLEYPQNPIKRFKDRPFPAGFGFVSPHWQQRLDLAGTYDETWKANRMPFFPEDFNRRFFNAAPPDQIYPTYLSGKETVMISNASSMGQINFKLPGVNPPRFQVQLLGTKDQILSSNLDTLIINTDDNQVFLSWRCFLPLRNGPQDVLSIKVIDVDQSEISSEKRITQ